METVLDLPTVEVWDDGGWGVLLPASSLPAGVAEIGITVRGIYIQLENARYDHIPWSELAELMDTEDADRVDQPVPYRLTALGLAAFLGDSVRVARGDVPVVVTGKELALLAWLNGGVEYQMQPERLTVQQNGTGVILADESAQGLPVGEDDMHVVPLRSVRYIPLQTNGAG